MSNRKKTRDQKTNRRSNRHRAKSWFQRGIEGRQDFPLHDEPGNPLIDNEGLVSLEAPEMEEVEVIKEVPAMHTGLPGGEHAGEKVQVGVAIIHSDRSIGLRYDEDAPLWALEEIQAFADNVGYSLETGGPSGTA